MSHAIEKHNTSVLISYGDKFLRVGVGLVGTCTHCGGRRTVFMMEAMAPQFCEACMTQIFRIAEKEFGGQFDGDQLERFGNPPLYPGGPPEG